MEIETAIFQFIKSRRGVSFAELARHIDGFEGPISCELVNEKSSNIFLWVGLSKDAYAAIEKLIASGKIVYKPTPLIVYLVDGGMLKMPLAKRIRHYKTPHWLPVTFDARTDREHSVDGE